MAAVGDVAWMRETIALASLAEGRTRPNPMVGCLLVADGEAVGIGHHLRAGGRHAEVFAVEQAGDRARGATAYVNLEPCAHHGRTAPCSDLLIEAGVRRVVAALQDPNPRVDGRGFERLRAAGIEVEVGVCAEAAERLNRPFLHWQRTGRPRVTLKAATSLDGRIAARGGRSRWITGDDARRVAHRLRLRHDAVMVGAGTVRADRPRLDVRLPVEALAPRVVVVSASLDLDPSTPCLDGATIFTGARPAPAELERVATIERVAERGERLDLDAVIARLGEIGVQSILVEGGGELEGALLEAGLADELALFTAPSILGGREAIDWMPQSAVDSPADAWRVRLEGESRLGADAFCWGTLERRR